MTTRIAVCSNHEHLCFGICDRDRYAAEVDSAIAAACAYIDDAGLDCESKCESFFRDWNGGKYYRPGQVIGGNQYGYSCGYVATLAVNPSQEICDLIDRASDLISTRLAEISKQEDADEAEAAAE